MKGVVIKVGILGTFVLNRVRVSNPSCSSIPKHGSSGVGYVQLLP